jgi:sec-independent protein translocase protein TatA
MNQIPHICSLSFISGMPGSGEIIVIFIVILVLFGPRKLPEIAKMIGRTLNQLRNASQEFRDEVMKIEVEVKDDIKAAAIDAIQPGDDEDPKDLEEGGHID